MLSIAMKRLIKAIYHLIPFKKQIFCVLRIAKPGRKIYRHLHMKGKFRVKLSPDVSFKMYSHGCIEENELFWKGIDQGWEKMSLNIWRKLSPRANIILDIGANTGIYSLVAAAMNPKAEVYAFEPLPKVVEYLSMNISLNGYNVHVIPKAVSDNTGKAHVFLREGEDFAYSVTVNKSLLSVTTPQKMLNVETVTLKDFIEEYNLKSIDLMKIDVETHEPEVLDGLGEYIDRFRPDMIIEIWDNDCAIKLNSMLQNKKYLFFDIDDERGTIIRKEKIEVSSFWNYLICKLETAQFLKLIE